jgi:hypothetical protein
MGECLSRLLSPVSAHEFFDRYRTRTHLHIPRDSPGFYDYILRTGDIDDMLQSGHLPAALLNVVKDGKRCPLEDWSRVETRARGASRTAVLARLFDLYLEGATLVLNEADRAIPSLNELCRALAVELAFPAHANVYITPGGSAGFSSHADDHEVLVLQITGSKRWDIGVGSGVEITLLPGDLLYLPRGIFHSAHAQERDSIHVTLGLRPVYAFQLIAELAVLAEEVSAFQQPAPPPFAGQEEKRAFNTAFFDQLQTLVQNVAPSVLLERRLRLVVKQQTQGWSGRLSDLGALRDIRKETIVRRRAGIVTEVKEEQNSLRVEFADKQVVVPAFLRGALNKILSGDAFVVGDLEGFLSDPGKVKLSAEFVRTGLLRIVQI